MQIIQHGTFIEIAGKGVLLTGPSQIGKSEIALSLIERGHRLIADDYVILQKKHNTIVGYCQPEFEGFLAIRDLGIINVIKLFGRQAISVHSELTLIINLTSFNEQQAAICNNASLEGSLDMQTLMNVNIPQQTFMMAPNRNLITLIETSVQIQQLRESGYDAPTDFISKQRCLIDNKT